MGQDLPVFDAPGPVEPHKIPQQLGMDAKPVTCHDRIALCIDGNGNRTLLDNI